MAFSPLGELRRGFVALADMAGATTAQIVDVTGHSRRRKPPTSPGECWPSSKSRSHCIINSPTKPSFRPPVGKVTTRKE